MRDAVGTRYETIRIGRKFALVTDHENVSGGAGSKSGWWCEDEAGGWGTSLASAWGAYSACVRPRLYPTKRAAMDAAGIL